MKYFIPIALLLLLPLYPCNFFAQSIVNTEKLFHSNDEGLASAAELMGSAISGNANVLLLEYSLNFRYRWKKNNLKFLSGGEYIREDNIDVSNSLFGQLRYNYHFSEKSRLLCLYQLQFNKILLLNQRQLIGLGFRQTIIEAGADSASNFKVDLTAGMMQEEEILNSETLLPGEKNYTNYTRTMLSLVLALQLKENITLINTTYLQQYIKNWSDYRLFNEVNLLIGINEWLSLSCDLEIRFDSEPPSSLKDKDINTNLGLLLNF
jgi:hypothetical protein